MKVTLALALIALAAFATVDAKKCKPCNCPMVYMPLCGSDNNTYNNRCEFDCAANCQNSGMSINYQGPCITCDSNVVCPMVWEPVCGSNGQTYGNSCQYGNAASCDSTLTISHTGEC